MPTSAEIEMLESTNYVVHEPATGRLLLVVLKFDHTLEEVQQAINERPHLGAYWEAKSFIELLQKGQVIYFTDLSTHARFRLSQFSNRGIYLCNPLVSEGEPPSHISNHGYIDLMPVETELLDRHHQRWLAEQELDARRRQAEYDARAGERQAAAAAAVEAAAQARARQLALQEVERKNQEAIEARERKERAAIRREHQRQIEARARSRRTLERRGLNHQHLPDSGFSFNGSDEEYLTNLRDSLEMESFHDSSGRSSTT